VAFIRTGSTVISFAEFQDVLDADQRLFETNEGLTDDVVETTLIRSTERILAKFRSSSWWTSYYVNRSPGLQLTTVADIPALDANKIQARQNDFTDLCVATAMNEYILPKIADFGTEDNAERNKMGYYAQRAEKLFGELITAGDWYNFDGANGIESKDKQPGHYNLKRVR
jgi:hypothetical protein